MKKQRAKYSVLSLLLLLFVAPGVAAYLFYQHPSWLSPSRVNKGVLLTSPLRLASIPGTTKWRIVFWSPEACDQSCLSQLDVLARVRLALGRRLYQVDQLLISGHAETERSMPLSNALKEKDFTVRVLTASELTQLRALSTQAQIFIMDPDNYLILSYQAGANPDDVYKDLKLLLNTAETKNG